MTGEYPTFSKYRLIARLGSGGMAEVYLAMAGERSGFNKLQVLKVMRSDVPEQERQDFLQMFRDEARLAARLSHPNIVQSHEVGSDEDQPFIAMEYLDGQPLIRVQQRVWAQADKAAFPLEMQLLVLCEVLEGLEYAHELPDYDGTPLNIVHRDVSPQNVFITYAGHTKLVDFGIAKTLDSSKTRAGVVKGKVAYMSPEQVLAARLDQRSDLFSVGVLLWEAIAGRDMHGETSVYQTLNCLVRGELPKLRDVVRDVPEALERIVARALALKPEDRYPNAASFRRELAAFLDSYRKVSPRDVGERVARLFARERAEINDLIRRAMKGEPLLEPQLGDLRTTRRLPALPGSTAAAPRPDPLAEAQTAPAQPTAQAVHLAPSHAAGPTPMRRLLWPAVAGTVLAGSVALLVLQPWQSPPAERPGPGVEQPARGQVQVDLRASPSQARFLLDGKLLMGNPYSAMHARDSVPHTLEVNAAGYEPLRSELSLAKDVSLQVQLASAHGTTPVGSALRPPSAPASSERPRLERDREPGESARRAKTEAAPDDEPFEAFPARDRRAKPATPALDKSDPWEH